MRGHPELIVGKTIAGVIIKKPEQRGRFPAAQLFLVFSDDTSYEFWVGEDCDIHAAGGLDRGGLEEARRYMSPPGGLMKIVFEKVLEDE